MGWWNDKNVHLFIGKTGIYIKENLTVNGLKAAGRLGKTLAYYAFGK
jgi:hypothetical protein